MTGTETSDLADAVRQLAANVKPARVPARRWLSKWLREETFWREMLTRTLSGLLVLLAVFVLGLATGFIKTNQSTLERIGEGLLLLAVFPVAFLTGALYVQARIERLPERQQAPRNRRLAATASFLWLAICVAGAGYIGVHFGFVTRRQG